MYMLIARLKAIFRWLAFQIGKPTYSAYSYAARKTSGYAGSYGWRGRCVAFRRDDGSVQFVW